MTIVRRKLIEVALPLEAINAASVREKAIRHGHPSTLHLWWARRPLAAARAVIFAQLVDDPSARPELFPTREAQEHERRRLFAILERLVRWESTNDEAVLGAARAEIALSWRRTCADNAADPRAAELFDPERLPAFHDPFAGGGALPLEAQRLGLESFATDLNPIAVLINRAMIELPPRFAGRPPVHAAAPADARTARTWSGAAGLADDVRHYGRWMRTEAERRIGALYPPVEITAAMAAERAELAPYAGRSLTVIAWIWARTVKSPNPAFASVDVPLAATFLLSTHAGREAYVEPVIDAQGYRFAVRTGTPHDPERAKRGTKLARGANFECLMSGMPIDAGYIKAEGLAGRMGARLMAIVAESDSGRLYLAPTPEQEAAAHRAPPAWSPDVPMPGNPRWFSPPLYGLTTYGDLFTPRQLAALDTFGQLVGEALAQVRADAAAAQLGAADSASLEQALAIYLAFAVDKCADYWSSLCSWHHSGEKMRNTFGRQAVPMVWDFAEANPFCDSTGNWMAMVDWVWKAVAATPARGAGHAAQADAQRQGMSAGKLVSTDPPYYDNIGYADLSDYFYVWLRRTLRGVLPDLFATLTVPKAEELVATPYRHGGKEQAEAFFLDGMTQALQRIATSAHPALPVTIYYAFKQAETETAAGTASTGWETFLDAVSRAGLSVIGTWPMRTELGNRMIGAGTNALASSIVLVCRPRPAGAPAATRRQFVAELQRELPAAIALLKQGNIAPVDLAQAAIGPSMRVYTRYAQVLGAEGTPLAVREALALVNQVLDATLAEQEGDFDAATRFAIAWFESHGFGDGDYGVADVLGKAKATSVQGLVDAGLVSAGRGKVRLRAPAELAAAWAPAAAERVSAWAIVHHLVRAHAQQGEAGAAALARTLGPRAAIARELAYRLYGICERKSRASEALSYNALVQSWPEIMRLAAAPPGAAHDVLDAGAGRRTQRRERRADTRRRGRVRAAADPAPPAGTAQR